MRHAFRLLALALIASPALATETSNTGHAMPAMAGDTTPSSTAFNDANLKMHADMAIQMTGNADADFVRGMVPHHQGAVDMARIVLQYGTDPEVRAFAEGVIAAQEAEIAWLKDWLAKNPN
ncbi:MAG TPA: DUF305 domain-containing protein [Paracoccaceae bacterium]|nr:DUF305 domain-containing protein [Paracoccaceae bacterium]